jgi:hypothetical protein
LRRKRFALSMLWAAFLLETFTIRDALEERFRTDPATFWDWLAPFFILVNGCYLALLLVRSRRANIALLVVQIILAFVPYWHQGFMARIADKLAA